MEFYTLDNEGVHAGIAINLPNDRHFALHGPLLRMVQKRLRDQRPDSKGARVLLAGGCVGMEEKRVRVTARAGAPDELGAVALHIDLPVGVDSDGNDLPIRVDGLTLTTGWRLATEAHVLVLLPGASITVRRPVSEDVEETKGLKQIFMISRTLPGRDQYPLIPRTLEPHGWVVRMK